MLASTNTGHIRPRTFGDDGRQENNRYGLSNHADAGNDERDTFKIVCARCRRLKVKCVFLDNSAAKCRRCSKSKQPCEKAISTRKMKRSEDDRVAQLQESVQSLESIIEKMRKSSSVPISSVPNVRELLPRENAPITLPAIKSFPMNPALSSQVAESSNMPGYKSTKRSASLSFDSGGIDELITTGVLSEAVLCELFDRSRRILSTGLCPLQIPGDLKYQDMYDQRPILLQVLVTISSTENPELHAILWERTKNRLLYEYYMNNTRRLELVQAFLLSCEYFTPSDQPRLWIHNSFCPLAIEVALDINLFQTPSSRREAFDELEHERTLLWLNTLCSSLLTANRRQPQRVIWTDYHTKCKLSLETSNYRDRQLAKMTSIPRLLMEIQECSHLLTSKALVDSFHARIASLEAEFGATPHPSAQIAVSSLILTLHEAYIRNSDKSGNDTQSIISKELCKNAAISVLYTTERLPGDVLAYPTVFLVRPLQCLVQLCKIFRHLNEDDGFAQAYCSRTEQALSSLERRGNGFAGYVKDKAPLIIKWFREAEVIRSDDAAMQVMQWNNNRKEAEARNMQSDYDLQAFIDIFQLSP